jgi:hypothetical protein
MKILKGLILLPLTVYSEIPEWYKRDIANHIRKAHGVIVYKVKEVTLESKHGQYNTYRINTETIEALKGEAPNGSCYMVHTEEKLKLPYIVGEKDVVILNKQYQGECGEIEPGFGAPATKEHVEFFKSLIKNGA